MTCHAKKRNSTYKTYAEAINAREDEKQKIFFCADCWGFHVQEKS